MMGNACIGICFASGVVNNKLKLFFKEEYCVLLFTFGCFAFRKEQGMFECVGVCWGAGGVCVHSFC